jgi:plasmid maintenance system killer protein
MKSVTLPSFWEAYQSLNLEIKRGARKAYRLWKENPFHPSLHFKCINDEEKIWSVRINRGYRAIGIFEGDTEAKFFDTLLVSDQHFYSLFERELT